MNAEQITNFTSIRNGLPHVAALLATGGPLRVVYFGGSITQAEGWRVGFHTWLQKSYPAAQIEMINAAIGGTGSDLGVFRVGRDVLAHNPDLVFLEFSVNDSGKDAALIGCCMEGVVRRLRCERPSCDVCLVYTLTNAPEVIEPFRRGELPPTAAVHDRIAAHYGLPAIFIGKTVVCLEREGRLVLVAGGEERARRERDGVTVFSEDGVHPQPAGHTLYTDVLTQVFPRLINTNAARSFTLPEPLDPANWEHTELVPLSALTRDAAITHLAPAGWPAIAWGREHVPELWRVSREGIGFGFSFTGTAFGVYDVIGPATGQLRVLVDGQALPLQPRFDPFCTYYRPNYGILADRLPRGIHQVRIELGPPIMDKAAILARIAGMMEDPAQFADNRWHPAAVLVAGKFCYRKETKRPRKAARQG